MTTTTEVYTPTREASVASAMTLGRVLVAVAARRDRATLRTLATIGGVFALASVLAPLSIDADLAAGLTLASLHLVPTAFYVAGIARLRAMGAGSPDDGTEPV